jgi:hypothetical protein
MDGGISKPYIFNFISAGSGNGLRRLMMKNNLKWGISFDYKILYVENEKKWYAWYRSDIDFNDPLDEKKLVENKRE